MAVDTSLLCMIGSRELVLRLEPAVAERFGDVGTLYLTGSFEVGECTGDAQDTVIAAGGEFQGFDGLGKKGLAGGVGFGDGFEEHAVGFGICADRVSVVALTLKQAGSSYARGYLLSAFGRWRQSEVLCTHGAYFNVKVYAVKQGAREFGLIIAATFRCAAASAVGFGEVTAATGIHRRDQLNATGIADVRIGSGDKCFATFERLAQ